MTAPATTDTPRRRLPAMGELDEWGSIVTSAYGWYGQYTVRHWYGNRTVYVCGQPEQHVRQGMWRRDGRMEGNGQGYVCCSCFPLEAGLYGIAERR